MSWPTARNCENQAISLVNRAKFYKLSFFEYNFLEILRNDTILNSTGKYEFISWSLQLSEAFLSLPYVSKYAGNDFLPFNCPEHINFC